MEVSTYTFFYFKYTFKNVLTAATSLRDTALFLSENDETKNKYALMCTRKHAVFKINDLNTGTSQKLAKFS